MPGWGGFTTQRHLQEACRPIAWHGSLSPDKVCFSFPACGELPQFTTSSPRVMAYFEERTSLLTCVKILGGWQRQKGM